MNDHDKAFWANDELKGEGSSNEKEDRGTWQSRFVKEYTDLRDRYNRLHRMIVRMDAGTIDFTPNCSIELLRRQERAMAQYLYILEVRAQIEHIDIN